VIVASGHEVAKKILAKHYKCAKDQALHRQKIKRKEPPGAKKFPTYRTYLFEAERLIEKSKTTLTRFCSNSRLPLNPTGI